MKIGNINSKLMAGLLAITFCTQLSGCVVSTYEIPTETSVIEETIDTFCEFDDIKDWQIVVFNVDGDNAFYIVKKFTAFSKYNISTSYRNVFDNKLLKTISIPSIAQSNIVCEGDLLSYLVIYGKIQSSYTEEELKEILEQIKADFELQEEKIKELEY